MCFITLGLVSCHLSNVVKTTVVPDEDGKPCPPRWKRLLPHSSTSHHPSRLRVFASSHCVNGGLKVSNYGGTEMSTCQSLSWNSGVVLMLDMEEFLMLRDLFNQGLSISEIARQTGYSRVTVRKYINSQIPPIPPKISNRPSKLDAYKEYIDQQFPLWL